MSPERGKRDASDSVTESSCENRCVIVVLLALFFVIGGCAPAMSPLKAGLLTPTTDLGGIGVEVHLGDGAKAPEPDALERLVSLGVRGRGRPAGELDALRTTLRQAVRAGDVATEFRERTIRLARERTPERIVNTPGAAIDTRLTLSLQEIGLVSRAAPSSTDESLLTLVLRGRLQLVRVSDGVELLARTMSYEGEAKPLGVWTADGAREFSGALVPAIEAFAAQIIDEVF